MKYWIKDFNIIFEFLYFSHYDYFFKLIWFYIFYKIFVNLYFYFFKLVFIDILKFLRLYTIFNNIVYISVNDNQYIKFLNTWKLILGMKTYVHWIFYYLDFLFYILFIFWKDLLSFLVYDFKRWWRKSVKWNKKFFMKDELDKPLAKYLFRGYGIYFLNRIKFTYVLRFIYFWIYLIYYYSVTLFKYFFLKIFKNYAYFFFTLFVCYKQIIDNTLIIFIWNFYIILRNGWYYVYNSYLGSLIFHWYRKFAFVHELDFNWRNQLREPADINKKGFFYFLLDLLLPWSFYKKQIKYGNFFSKNIFNILFYIINIFFLYILNFLSKLYLKNINIFQKYYILKLKFLRYSLILYNINISNIIFSYIIFIFYIFLKYFYYIIKIFSKIFIIFKNILEICIVSLEFCIIFIIQNFYALFLNIIKYSIELINYICLYRLIILIFSIIIFINIKYILLFFVYFIAWFFEWYLLDWIILPDMLHRITPEPFLQAEFLILEVDKAVLAPVTYEQLCKTRFDNVFKYRSWSYVLLHCIKVVETFIKWEYSRIFTFEVFVNWKNVYCVKFFYYTTGYKIGLICACLDYFFIDYIIFFFLDAWDIFLYITKIDIIFFKIQNYIKNIFLYLDENVFYYFKSTGSKIKFELNIFILKIFEYFYSLQAYLMQYLSFDGQMFVWYFKFFLTLSYVSIFEFYNNFYEYYSMLLNKLLFIQEKLNRWFLKFYIPIFTWMVETPLGTNFFKDYLIKLQEFIFKYKLSFDGLVFDIENVEQRMLKNSANKVTNYQFMPGYEVNHKSFFHKWGIEIPDPTKKVSENKKGPWSFLSQYQSAKPKKRRYILWSFHIKAANVKFFKHLREESLDLFGSRHPKKGLFFFSPCGVFTNLYSLHESFSVMKKISILFANAKFEDKRNIFYGLDKKVISKFDFFYRWTQDIEYTAGNYSIWKSCFWVSRFVNFLAPEFHWHKFPVKGMDLYIHRWRLIYWRLEEYVPPQKFVDATLKLSYAFPRFWFFHDKNFYHYNYLKNPEHIFDFTLGTRYRELCKKNLANKWWFIKFFRKDFKHKNYYLMDDFKWFTLSPNLTLKNLHYLMLLFFPIFLMCLIFISGFHKICLYNFEEVGDPRYWWRRFREQDPRDIKWVTETLSDDVFKFLENYQNDVSKKGRKFIENQSMDFLKRQSFQVARWTLLKKYKLVDKASYFKDFVVGKNFLLFHSAPSYENFWNLRFKSIQSASNLELLLAYGFSRDKTIKNLVINDFDEFEDYDTDSETFQKFLKMSDKYIDLCFNLDRDLFNFKLPSWSYHKDILNLSYVKTPENLYLFPDALPANIVNFQYWFIDVLTFFISIYSYRLGIHQSRLALNEFWYFMGTLWGHSDLSFYWTGYWFGLHWFSFNFFNIEYWPVNSDFDRFKVSREHSSNASYFGPLSITFDYSINQINILNYRFKTMTISVLFYFIFNIICFIYIILYFKKMRTNLVTNKSIKINKVLIDLMGQSFFSIDYLFIYFNKILGVKSKLADFMLKKEKIK